MSLGSVLCSPSFAARLFLNTLRLLHRIGHLGYPNRCVAAIPLPRNPLHSSPNHPPPPPRVYPPTWRMKSTHWGEAAFGKPPTGCPATMRRVVGIHVLHLERRPPCQQLKHQHAHRPDVHRVAVGGPPRASRRGGALQGCRTASGAQAPCGGVGRAEAEDPFALDWDQPALF